MSNIPATQLTVSEDDLKGPLAYWDKQVQAEENPAARLVRAQLLKMCGRTAEAIQQLETGLADHPESRPLLAKLYEQENRTEEADSLYDQMLQELDRNNQISRQRKSSSSVLIFWPRPDGSTPPLPSSENIETKCRKQNGRS